MQDDVERLVPRNVLQAQGDIASHGVAGHNVEIGEVGNDLQQGTHFDVLKVQRQLLAGKSGPLRELVGVDLLLPDFKNELVVALVRTVLPGTTRIDNHPDAITSLCARHKLNGRAEVGHIEPLAHVLGQGGAQEFDDEALALLANVDADLVVRKIDHHSPGTVCATAEVDALERKLVRIQALCKALRRRRCRRPCCHGCRCAVENQKQNLALKLRAVAGRLLQVEHEPSAFTRLRHAH